MQTCCPACQTTFQITEDQLLAKNGNVRCGQCRLIFDARAHLIETEEDVPVLTEIISSPTQVPEDVPHRGLPEEKPPRAGALSAQPPSQEAQTPPLPSAEEAKPSPPYQIPSKPEKESSSLALFLAALFGFLLVFVLASQAIFHFRGEIAARWPATARPLENMSRLFGQDMAYPKEDKAISIESSEMSPKELEASVALLLTLRNRTPLVQTWPLLEVTLTDRFERPAFRKILSPKDYLPAPLRAQKAFAPSSEIALRLTMSVGDADISGYRLSLFYAKETRSTRYF